MTRYQQAVVFVICGMVISDRGAAIALADSMAWHDVLEALANFILGAACMVWSVVAFYRSLRNA